MSSFSRNKQIKRLTYFTIFDPEGPIGIRDKKRKNCNFCVGANLDDLDEELDQEADIKSNQEEEAYVTRRVSIDLEGEEISTFKKTFFWICGIESQLKKSGKPQVEQVQQVDTSIDQDPRWALVCDINAIIAVALSGFCIAFFNIYE